MGVRRDPPALRELGDERQPAAALVEAPGTAQVRGGAAGAGDLADQGGVAEQPELDRAAAGVADRFGHQLADDQFGEEHGLPEPPFPTVAPRPRRGDDDRGVGQFPCDDLTRVEGHGRSAGRCRRRAGPAAARTARCRAVPPGSRRAGWASREQREPRVDVVSGRLDQAVGGEGRQAALGRFELSRREGRSARGAPPLPVLPEAGAPSHGYALVLMAVPPQHGPPQGHSRPACAAGRRRAPHGTAGSRAVALWATPSRRRRLRPGECEEWRR